MANVTRKTKVKSKPPVRTPGGQQSRRKEQRTGRKPPGAQNNAKKAKKLRRGKGRPFTKGNPWRFPPGQSGNPGGRPKALRDAYTEWLKLENSKGITNAMFVAITMGTRAILGDTQSAKEIRMATEGTTINTWQSEIIGLLKEGKLTAQDVMDELGDEATELLDAAGLLPNENGAPEGESPDEATSPGAEPVRVDVPIPQAPGAGPPI
jgi:hypothetical protein